MTKLMTPIEKFATSWRDKSLSAALDELGDYLIEHQRFHELFELRKVQLRLRLGLPVDQWQPMDDLPPDQGQLLENGLLEICREIGSRLVRSGDLATGWSYLEPVGDKRLIRELINEVPVTDDNAESLIHIAIAGGVDPLRGFQVVLDRFGTCSSITTYETQLAGAPVETRRGPVGLLVRHVYRELVENVQRAVGGHPQPALAGDEPGTLRRLLDAAPALTEGLNHHLDTTHLASTVRFSRILDHPDEIELAIELAEYGQLLHEDFQYPGTAPFGKTYPDTLEFLRALRGDQVEVAVQRLRQQAVRQRDEAGVLDAAAWYVYLLDQLNRGPEAVEAWLELLHQVEPDHVLGDDVAPSLQRLVRRYGMFDRVGEILQQRGDLLGFAMVAAARDQAAAIRHDPNRKRPASS